ncbi:MAG TPA: phosphopantetheine-binding protein [Pirellulales bacterium]|jgi:acyl carrier protein|nr:phosphopantetheine-binding protein [Pirellulales bacterium]
MNISLRTPEGLPHGCPVCGNLANIEPSLTTGDSCCPNCGHLLWWFRDRLERQASGSQHLSLASPLSEFGTDSLDMVVLAMELEEEFGVAIPDDAAERIETVADAIRYIQQQRRIEPA